jgi:hypothetical protein
MANDTITFMLEGEIPLDSFATAVTALTGLIKGLSNEMAAPAEIDWIIEDLEPGSALIVIKGRSDTQPEYVERVVQAYASVGRALQRGEQIAHSRGVIRRALKIGRMVNGRVKSVRFETAETDVIISPVRRLRRKARKNATDGAPEAVLFQLEEEQGSDQPAGAYGAIEGTVQMLTNRHGLRFTLYDTLNDRAVSCYLDPGMEDIMRDVWGKPAVVEGWVSRDDSGHPISVLHVSTVDSVQEGDYTVARTILPIGPDDELPERLIRRTRDA